MQINYRIIILVFFLPLLGLGQGYPVAMDSLINIYETTTSDKEKLRIGQSLADSLRWTNRIQAKKYALETFPLAKVSDDPLLKSYGYFLIHSYSSNDPSSELFNGFKHLDTAEIILKQNFKTEKTEKVHNLQLTIHNARGLNYFNQGEMDQAIKNYQKALTIAKEQDFKEQISLLNYNISICHFVLTNYDEALVQLKETYEFANKNGNAFIAADALHILGATYQELGSLDQAKNYVAGAMKMAKSINHEIAYQETLLSMGTIYEELNELDSSQHYLELCLEKTLGQDASVVESQIYQHLARVESKKGNSKEARRLFKKAVALNNKINRKDTHYELAIDIAGQEYKDKNYKEAYDLLELAYEKKDSLTSLENRKSLSELELKYGKAEDETLIATQQLSLVKNQKKITNLTGGLLFSLLGLLTFYAFYRNSVKSQEIVQKELAIKQIELETMEKEKSILALSSTLEGQEAERARIAQDLHDGLGGLLSSVKAHYGKIQKEIKKLESLQVFNSAEGMLDNACEEVRRISHNLMPPLLRSHGLIPAIQGLVNNYRSSSLKITLDTRNMENRLQETQEVFLYRIAQELLANIRKHAGASTIEISLYGLKENVQLIIEDNGVGFDPQNQGSGLGLQSVNSRVEYLSGQLDIETSPGQGTTVSIDIPRT